MVDSQIHTMGVVSETVLDAYRTVAREEFVPADRRAIAYNDEDLTVAAGRALMEPATHARLLQATLPTRGESVLDIGGATGYSAAILARIGARVVAAEPDSALLSQAQEKWRELGYGEFISGHLGGFSEGCPVRAPYDLILVNGTMAEIPETLVAQLAEGGRMAMVLRKAGERIGRAILVTKGADGLPAQRVLFDAAVPYLPGHEPRNSFVF